MKLHNMIRVFIDMCKMNCLKRGQLRGTISLMKANLICTSTKLLMKKLFILLENFATFSGYGQPLCFYAHNFCNSH